MFDAIPISFYVVAFGIIGIIGAYACMAFNSEIQSSFLFPDTAKTAVQTTTNTFGMFDYIGVLLFIGLSLVAIISAFSIRAHPAFFFLMIFVQLISVMFSYILSQVYLNVSAQPALAAAVALFPNTTWLVSNFPIIILALSCLLAIVTYGKPSNATMQM